MSGGQETDRKLKALSICCQGGEARYEAIRSGEMTSVIGVESISSGPALLELDVDVLIMIRESKLVICPQWLNSECRDRNMSDIAT